MADQTIQQPPAYCQYSVGPCDQSFDGIDKVKGVVLYPSHPPQIAAVIQTAVERLNSRSNGDWLSWRDFRSAGQTIFCSICRQIRFCSVIVADVTTLNFNLLFEIGFVLGLNLPLLLIRDTSYLRDLREFNELGLLDTIGYLDFKTADGLADIILRNLPAPVLDAPPATLIRDTPMYVIKDPIGHEGQVRLLSTLKKSPLRFRSYDPLEDSRLTLHDARRQVGASFGIVGHLLAPERRGSVVHNARTALVAGLAVANGRRVILLQEGESTQPIDYRDIVSSYATANQIPTRLEKIIYEVTVGLQEDGPATQRTPFGLLEQLDLGDLAAENEIRQLRAYFVRTAQFNQARQGHARLVVGRKGAGKTAIFYAVRDSLPRNKHDTCSGYEAQRATSSPSFARLYLPSFRQAFKNIHSPLFGRISFYVSLHRTFFPRTSPGRNVIPSRFEKFESLRNEYQEQMPDDTGDLSERLLRQIDRLAARFERAELQTDPRELTNALFGGDIPKLDRVVAPYLTEKQQVWLLVDNLDKGWPIRGASEADILIIKNLT